MHTVSPLDTSTIMEVSEHAKLIVTVEEHSVHGGLGSAVMETLALKRNHPPILTLGHVGKYPKAASYKYLLEQAGLNAAGISTKIMQTLKECC